MISRNQTLCLELLQRNLGSLRKDEDVPTLISHGGLATEIGKMQLGSGIQKCCFEEQYEREKQSEGGVEASSKRMTSGEDLSIGN
jgi:hypothetical protein